MTKSIVAALLLLAIVFVVAHLEYRFTPTEQALREHPPFQRPLACDAIVAQRSAGEPFVSRCYIKSSSQ